MCIRDRRQRERERDRDRETERDRDRNRQRQTDRQRGRQIDRLAGRQAGRLADRATTQSRYYDSPNETARLRLFCLLRSVDVGLMKNSGAAALVAYVVVGEVWMDTCTWLLVKEV